MYIQRIFGVYFILSSDTGPIRFLFLFFIFSFFFFFQVEMEFEFDLSCFVLLTAMRVGKQTSKD